MCRRNASSVVWALVIRSGSVSAGMARSQVRVALPRAMYRGGRSLSISQGDVPRGTLSKNSWKPTLHFRIVFPGALKAGTRPRGPSAGDPVESLISLKNIDFSGRFDHEVSVRATHHHALSWTMDEFLQPTYQSRSGRVTMVRGRRKSGRKVWANRCPPPGFCELAYAVRASPSDAVGLTRTVVAEARLWLRRRRTGSRPKVLPAPFTGLPAQRC